MKIATPVNNIRLRPKRSHTTAARISVAPATIVYELRTHDSSADDTSGNERIKSGNATLIIDWFSAVRKVHVDARARTIQARREIVDSAASLTGCRRIRPLLPRCLLAEYHAAQCAGRGLVYLAPPVLHDQVVPHDEIASLPMMLVDVGGVVEPLEQHVEQRIAIGAIETEYLDGHISLTYTHRSP